MSTSDADKPPICSPVTVVVPPPVLPGSDARAASDATIPSAQRYSAPRTFLHWTFLAIAVVVITASLTLTIRNGEQVFVPILNVPLPGTCTFRTMTGLPCPGCGLTRSFISMGHGRLRDAWNYNPAGFLFFVIVAFQIPYRIYQIRRIRRGLEQHRFAGIDNWTLIVLVIALIVQWLCAMAAGWM